MVEAWSPCVVGGPTCGYRIFGYRIINKAVSASKDQCRFNLTLVANVVTATGPALLAAPQSCVFCSLLCLYAILEFSSPRQTRRRGPIIFTCYTETSSAESKLNFSFCLGICFWVKSISYCKLLEIILFLIFICLEHLHIIFALFSQTNDLLQNLVNVTLRVINKVSTKL